jgi:ribosomal protein S24E
MELNIIEEKQNPLFKRKEIIAKLTSRVSPKNSDVLSALAEKFSVEKNAIKLVNIKGKFGTNEFKVIANIYPSNEERDKVERLTKKEKEVEQKEAEAAAKPAEEAPKESAPEQPAENTEAPKEEVKTE